MTANTIKIILFDKIIRDYIVFIFIHQEVSQSPGTHTVFHSALWICSVNIYQWEPLEKYKLTCGYILQTQTILHEQNNKYKLYHSEDLGLR